MRWKLITFVQWHHSNLFDTFMLNKKISKNVFFFIYVPSSNLFHIIESSDSKIIHSAAQSAFFSFRLRAPASFLPVMRLSAIGHYRGPWVISERRHSAPAIGREDREARVDRPGRTLTPAPSAHSRMRII